MANLSIDQFKAALKGGGTRPNYFQVTPAGGTTGNGFPGSTGITAPGTTAPMALPELASVLIKAASLPNSTTGEIQVPFRGRQLFVAGDRTFEPWSITVVNDTNFAIRNAFEEWLNLINSHVGNVSAAGNIGEYTADWKVAQLDKAGGAVLKEYVMRGAFPVAVDPIDLSYDSTDEISTFNVTMRYQYWTSDSTDQVGAALPV